MNSPAPVTEPALSSPIPGFKVLLEGPSGTGKTHSLRTLIDCGLTPFVIFTEVGMDLLADIPCPKLHWQFIKPMTAPWTVLQASAKSINEMSFAALKSLVDPNKSKYMQYWQFLGAHNDFVCDRCKQHFGDVSTWNTDRVLVVDGLTGVNNMVSKLTVGGKPNMDQSEWGIAQNTIYDYLQTVVNGAQAHYVLISHVDREMYEATGELKLTVSTLGKKLAPKIPPLFTDVVMAQRNGTQWVWNTTESTADLKARNLSWGKDLSPSFMNLFQGWTRRGGIICPTVGGNTQAK